MNRLLLSAGLFVAGLFALASCDGVPYSSTSVVTDELATAPDDMEKPPAPATVAAIGDFAPQTVAIGLVVTDLAASERFYGEILGLTATGGFEVDTDFAKRSGLTEGSTLPVRTYSFGDGPTATTLKLVPATTLERRAPDTYVRDNHGVQYLTVYLSNLAGIKERLEAAGVKYLGETPIIRGGDNEDKEFILVQDPDGTFVELIQV